MRAYVVGMAALAGLVPAAGFAPLVPHAHLKCADVQPITRQVLCPPVAGLSKKTQSKQKGK